ncbi:DNA repair protein rad16 [Steccherinum ochraceum]|uniref:DNA repair protein rad16 n=1 Tax=Steccherinum ochraceum TaxID=92696 RepID=A0A4R0RS77_9APHY|nr:DNA repair protein rad16 [Steccherinum ochraceum]
MVATRRSTRASSSATTPGPSSTSTLASPATHSAAVSTQATTPDPSPSENEAQRVANGVKAGTEFSHANAKAVKGIAPSLKRRASQVYVDIPVKQTKTSKKATVSKRAQDDSEEEVVESDGLEYDENASYDESDVDGSEYQMSGEDSDAVENNSGDEGEDFGRPSNTRQSLSPLTDVDDEDAVMMHVAMQESLQTTQAASMAGNSSGSAISTKQRTSDRSKRAQKFAAAAERRLKLESEDVIMIEDDSEEEEAVVGKGKKKATKQRITKSQPATSKVMTLTQMRKQRREQRKQAQQNKSEEAALRKKLGRKLTPAEKSTIALHKHHPELKDIWGNIEREIVIPVPQKAEPPARLKATLLPFQLESLHWMKLQEKSIWNGGLLADEMGMGKTIQMLALLCSDAGAKPNLVVAPTVAVMQWKNEVELHTESLKVLVWHGASRETNATELRKFDVVLTTYAVLESCFRKQHSGFKRKGKIVKEKSVVHQIEWNRVILDEAHNIKERATNTAKATFELKAKTRWCLSGTPLQNRVGELYSMIRFLGGDPFSFYFCKQCDCKSLHWKFSDKRSCDDCGHSPMKHTCFWNNEILTPIQKNGMTGPGAIAFKKLKILLDRMMLRRTKLQRADDLGLPPRTVIIRRDYFSPEEKELYQSLFSDAKRQFTTFVDSGTILNNYSNIFSLLTRMRQMACHPDLVLRSKTNANTFLPDNMGEATLCRLCNDIAEDAIQARCRHIFDRECIKQYLDSTIVPNPACPVCHVPLTIDLEAPALDLEENTKTRQGILGRLDLDKWRSSSKIEALIEELSNLKRQNATTKSIVFSQFVNFLDLIAFRLQKAGFSICRLEGTMSPQARDATIKHFMNNVHVTVFLVSLKAGGVALNLTEASRVYLMDSWWNPAVEYQAMDRIHRLGQHRPVQAIKLVVEDSIESRIIQEKKAAMVDATLSADDSAMGRLTPEDLGFLFRL